MSKQLRTALQKLTHGDGNSGSSSSSKGGSRNASGAATPTGTGTGTSHPHHDDVLDGLPRIDSDINSPVASGASTPVVTRDPSMPSPLGASETASVASSSSATASNNASAAEYKQQQQHHKVDSHDYQPTAAHHNNKEGHKDGGKHGNFLSNLIHHGDSKNHHKEDKDNNKKEGEHDLHEHFMAIKAQEKNKHHSHGSSTSSSSTRPGMHHTKTEEDARALKVDRQAELHEEQIKRELAWKEAYEKDPLNIKYGFLNVDATPNQNVDISGK